jgi:hypothetical protein
MPALLRQTVCKDLLPDTLFRPLHAGSLPFGASFFSYGNPEFRFGHTDQFIVSIRTQTLLHERNTQTDILCLQGFNVI